MDKDEIISAFAFKTGKLIEELIKEQTDDLQGRNKILETKIVQWYLKSNDEDFAKHFGITTVHSSSVL